MSRQKPTERSLRRILRHATADAHDRLDAAVGAGDLTDRAHYARFLQTQRVARTKIEEWVRANANATRSPPEQSQLIVADLQALQTRNVREPILFACDADDGATLGVAWALAGSSLGNRMMLNTLKEQACGDRPVAFLSDPTMFAYWKKLKPVLDREYTQTQNTAAIAAAEQVFATFMAAHEQGDATAEMAA